MSNTPRTDEQTFDVVVKRGDAHLVQEHYKDGYGDFVESDFCKKLERELNAANQIAKKYEDRYFDCLERIKRLEEMYEGEIGENEQFLGSNLQGLLTRELNWSKQRIKQLESWIESLELLEQHSGILPEREWFGSEIGYLRKGEAVYKGEAKP